MSGVFPAHTTRCTRRAASGLGLAALALGATACGKSSTLHAGSSARNPAAAARGHRPATRGVGVPAASVTVIEGWSDALRAGQRRRAAGYWALPSAMVNGFDASGRLSLLAIDSEHDALLADDSLSCGATLRRATRAGSYVRADFELSVRTGPGASSSGCSGPASVLFKISSGHITRWLRAPATPRTVPGGAAPRSQSI